MQQPPGFADNDTSLVYNSKKAIYGLKQAPWTWYDKFHQALVQFGFVSNRCDHLLFIYQHQGITLYALAYVDDILVT